MNTSGQNRADVLRWRKRVSLIDMGVVSHEANEDFEEQESKRFAWLARKVSWIEL